MLNLTKLFLDVFDPQPGECAAVMVDLPHDEIRDNTGWQARRDMACRWRDALEALGNDRGFDVLSLIEFEATGGNNAQLPASGRQNGKRVDLEEIFARATLLLAMTEFSASAPLIESTRKHSRLRVASMPRVSPEMEKSALAADYAHVARSCGRLRDRLAAAAFADFEFSTGDRFRFDFRFRQPEVDDGRLPINVAPPRLINLPSGEAYVAAYEGERGMPSLTAGVMPIPWNGEIVPVRIASNHVEEVIGTTAAVGDLRNFLFTDPARRNVAELGLGCNPIARVWGNVLEDEKAGPHIALGRSEHLGGSVGPDAFLNARNVWHEDFVYARGCSVQITELVLTNDRGEAYVLFANGSYAAELEVGI